MSIILASGSPRRRSILKELGLDFRVVPTNVDESYPDSVPPQQVASFLATKKALFYPYTIDKDDLVITADTIVILDNQVLGKPKNLDDARAMLKQMSGRMHRVITAVCITTKVGQETFQEQTKVHLRELLDKEIDYYLERHNPMDKAGSYGAQEYLGMIGIDRIDGSYYNIMGLPINLLYPFIRERHLGSP